MTSHITTLRDLRASIQADTAQSPASEQLEALEAAMEALTPKEGTAADRADFEKLCAALGADVTLNDSCGYADERVNAAWLGWRRPGVDPRGIFAILRSTFDAGFEASAQGFDTEHPGGHQDDPTYRHERAVAVNAALKKFQLALSLDDVLATVAPDLHAVLHSHDEPGARSASRPIAEKVWMDLVCVLEQDNGGSFPFTWHDFAVTRADIQRLVRAGHFAGDRQDINGDHWTMAAGEKSVRAALHDALLEVGRSPG